jgi:hypothetical protein
MGCRQDQSLSERYALLKKELAERKVELLVCVLTDGHSSRTGEKICAECTAHGLRQWLEMADTSGWAQMWDHLFKGFHAEYSVFSPSQRPPRGGGSISSSPLTSWHRQYVVWL